MQHDLIISLRKLNAAAEYPTKEKKNGIINLSNVTSKMLLNFESLMFYCLSATQAYKFGDANAYLTLYFPFVTYRGC